MARTYIISEICGDWALQIREPGHPHQFLYFNSENNANLVKSILEWEDTHQNEAVPYKPTLTPPNEPLTLDEIREINGEPIYVTTKNYGDGWCILNWHGVNKSYTYFSRTGTSEGMTATPLSAKTYGDLWLAYRRPPEGEADGK